MTDGDIILANRVGQDLGCNELAKRAGLSAGQISRYERGERKPTLDQARRICRALGVSLALFDKAE